MAEKSRNSRRPEAERPAPRREGMIHCENCGEDYAATYKRCPFCDERPDRPGGRRQVTNKRGGGYGGAVTPFQIAAVVVSLVIIIAAAYIVFAKLLPAIFGGHDDPAPAPGPSTSQVDPAPLPDVSPELPDVVEPEPVPEPQPEVPSVTASSITFHKNDFTLKPGESFTIKAQVEPASAAEALVWTSDNPDVLKVTTGGTVTNVNATGDKVKVTITAAIGEVKATATAYCQSGAAVNPTPDKPTPEKPEPKPEPQPSGNVKPNTPGTIVNAGSGLNVRSGPGTSYEVLASVANGNKVSVMKEENGWYQIDYGNGKLGYVSKDFVQVK